MSRTLRLLVAAVVSVAIAVSYQLDLLPKTRRPAQNVSTLSR